MFAPNNILEPLDHHGGDGGYDACMHVLHPDRVDG
jgi:hypothetical protein